MKPIRLKPDEVRAIFSGETTIRRAMKGEAVSPYPVGSRFWGQESFRRGDGGSLIYRADEPWHTDAGWTPSQHMDCMDSRITLEVTAVSADDSTGKWVWVIGFAVEVKR